MRIIAITLIISICSITSAFAEKTLFKVDFKANTVTFTSSAPIETIVGQTQKISGSLEFDPEDMSQPSSGIIEVDLASLNTGIEMRDEHMRSEDFLNTAVHPSAVFEVKKLITPGKGSLKSGETFDVVALGEFTLHGVTKDLSISGKGTYFDSLPQMKDRGFPAEVFTFKSTFSILMEEYGIKRPQMLMLRVADEVIVDITFTAAAGK